MTRRSNDIYRLSSPKSTAVGLTQDQWDYLLEKTKNNNEDYPLCYSVDEEDDEDDDDLQETGAHMIDCGDYGSRIVDVRDEIPYRIDNGRQREELDSLGGSGTNLHNMQQNLSSELDFGAPSVSSSRKELQGCDVSPPSIVRSGSFDSQFLNETTCPTIYTGEDDMTDTLSVDISLNRAQKAKIDMLQTRVEQMARMMGNLAELDGGTSVITASTSQGSGQANVVVSYANNEGLEQQAALDRLTIAGLRARNSTLSSENAELRAFVSDMEKSLLDSKAKSTDVTHKIALEVENTLLRRHLSKLRDSEVQLLACPYDEYESENYISEDESGDDIYVPNLNYLINAVRSKMSIDASEGDNAQPKIVSDLQQQVYCRDRKLASLKQQLRETEAMVRDLRAAQPLMMSSTTCVEQSDHDYVLEDSSSSRRSSHGQCFPRKKISWNKLLGRSLRGSRPKKYSLHES